MDLKDLIHKGESDTVELKKSVAEWKEIVETVSAFSNTKGGVIIVGVGNNGKIYGINIGKNTIEDLTNKVLTNTDPKIYPEITVSSVEDKKVIVIKVEKFPYDVVFAFGRPFERVGRSTVRMSKDEYKRRILEIHKKEIYFDGHILDEATIKDIDEDKLSIFIKKSKRKKRAWY